MESDPVVGTKAFAVGRDSDGCQSLCNAFSARTTPVKRPASKHQPQEPEQQQPKTVEVKRRTSRRPHHHQQNAGVRADPRSHALPARRGVKERREETLLAATTPTVAEGSNSGLLIAASENQTVIDNSRLQQQSPLQTTLRTPTPAPAPKYWPGRRDPPTSAADGGRGTEGAKQRGGNSGGDGFVGGRTTPINTTINNSATVRKLHTSQEAVIAVETRAGALLPAPAGQPLGRKASAEVSVCLSSSLLGDARASWRFVRW